METRDGARPERTRWQASPVATLGLLFALAANYALAIAFTDPDFYLPDPFRVTSLALIAVFVVAGFVPSRLVRESTRLLAILTVVAIAILEIHSASRDYVDVRIQQSDDRLLRYHYSPGVTPAPDLPTITADGLLDVEHVVPKPADVYRVVLLTGSIANDGSIPFEDRFFRRLGPLLEASLPGKHVDVVNVSCEGFNTLQQVRLLEQVGLRYEPDLVVVGFMLTSAVLQNGGHRRIGNSYFAFRFLPFVALAREGTMCALFEPFFERYSYDLIVRNSFERLRLLSELHHFRAVVAVLPIVEKFDDPLCQNIYAQVARTAEESGLPAIRVVDAFAGHAAAEFMKPRGRFDVAHPNPAGHALIARAIADGVRSLALVP
ncbi:MAG: hypothetical protein H6700_06850 [Myxococcales bacterium]|nr:hypothetical protein [Myxococcales bacterium]MCB9531466.1 hypothetical protein [Myxococcales bacterium]